jgi:glycosyltransferase involved in cell wall biosynthesis
MTSPVPCGIRDIDLNAPLPALVAESSESSVLAFFWQNGVPVGRRLFLEAELPVTASAMSALAAAASASALSKLDVEAKVDVTDRSDVSPSDVSVIVCTRDRPEQLRHCIAAISDCEPRPGEIIVVDNSSTPGSLDIALKNFPSVRIVHESRPGLSFARNTGLAAATGTIIAFTDDDVTVTPNWIKALAVSFSNQNVGAVTGPVLPGCLQSDAEFAFEFDIGGLASSFEPRSFDKSFLDTGILKAPHVWEIGAGANFSIRKAVLDDIGPFDERLGAGAAGCSEDSEFLYRLLQADWICHYRPEVVVRHNHRGDVNALRSQMRAYMRGHVAALFVQYNESRHIGNLARALLGIPCYHLSWVVLRAAHLLGFGWLEPWGRTARATRFAQALGSAEGLFYLLRHRGAPKFSSRATETEG